MSRTPRLVEDHEGYATLTMIAVGAAPMVILDYGRDVGGIPVFEVSAVSGNPKLQAFYSESQQYLLPAGDGNSPSGVSFVGDCGGRVLSPATPQERSRCQTALRAPLASPSVEIRTPSLLTAKR